MSASQIIEAVADLPLTGEAARKADYVIGQYLDGDRSDSDLAMLADSVRALLRGVTE